jgi:DNA-binding transcriptional regulator YdaS (Cro superfamily)
MIYCRDMHGDALDGLRRAAEAAGGKAALARLLGLSRQAVHRWHRVPADRLDEVERATGVPREVLRPDIFHRSRPAA